MDRRKWHIHLLPSCSTGFTLFYHYIVHIWDLSSAPSNDHCKYPSQIQKGYETFIIISLF